VATEPGSDFGGDALQEVVAVNGLSIPKTVNSLSVSSYSIAEDMTEGGTVNDSTTILTCRVGTASPGSPCASACSSASEMRTDPNLIRVGLRWRVATVNGLSIQVTDSGLRAPTWLVAEGISKGGADFGETSESRRRERAVDPSDGQHLE